MYPILGILILVLDILAIVQIWSGGRSSGEKLVWTLLILFLPLLGLILWYLLGRRSATV